MEIPAQPPKEVDDMSELIDDFRGDNNHLIAGIEALLDLDAAKTLVPHGIGGHARGLLSAAGVRLAAKDAEIAELREWQRAASKEIKEADRRAESLINERNQARQDHANASVKLAQCVLRRDEARECVGRLFVALSSIIDECASADCRGDSLEYAFAEEFSRATAALAATPEHLRGGNQSEQALPCADHS